MLHSWESSWVEGTEAWTLVARLRDNRKAPRPPTPTLLCTLLCTEPLHQAHPSLLGKADESTPGDKELSRTRLATPNHEASATRQQHPSFCERGVGSRWSPVWAAQLAEAANEPQHLTLPPQVPSPRGRGASAGQLRPEHRAGPKIKQETSLAARVLKAGPRLQMQGSVARRQGEWERMTHGVGGVLAQAGGVRKTEARARSLLTSGKAMTTLARSKSQPEDRCSCEG